MQFVDVFGKWINADLSDLSALMHTMEVFN